MCWRPVTDAVTKRVNEVIDADSWLADSAVDGVVIVLGRPGLVLFEPGRVSVSKKDRSVVCDLSIPDAIADSRDPHEVHDFLLRESLAMMPAVAKKLRIAAPAQRPPGERKDSVPGGQVAALAAEYGGAGPLVLLAPRYADRPRFDELKNTMREAHLDNAKSWPAYTVDVGASTDGPGVECVFDFSAFPTPFQLDTLVQDDRNALVVIVPAADVETAEPSTLKRVLDRVAELLPVVVTVVGNDDGTLWLAARLDARGEAASSTT